VLVIEVPMTEAFDESKMEFVTTSAYKLELEHSLVSLSKWEQKFEKPFLSNDEKTPEETLWYVKAMSLNPEVPPEVFSKLTNEHISKISEYINGNHTATWFREDPNRPRSHEVFTNEVFYYYMLTLSIDISAENWHLNRLITLIRVTNEKNAPPKKMNQREAISSRRDAMAKRRAQVAAAQQK